MNIDSLTSTEVYVEKKVLITITADAKTNNRGILEVDDKGNKLISIVDSGDTHLYRVSEYKGTDSILFYNSTTKQLSLAKEKENINVDIDFEKGTQYYCGAKRMVCKNSNKNVFNCDLTGYRIFKVFLDNGREITSYNSDDTTITILGNDRLYLDEFSEITVYVYTTNSTKPILMSNVDYSFKVEFFGYEAILDLNEMLEGNYFQMFKGDEVTLFDSLELSESVTKDTTRSYFAVSSESRVNAVENSIDLQTFIGDGSIDLPQYIGTDEFRMICVNPTFGRIVFINNCFFKDGVSPIYTKERNSKKYKISCGNYIDINLHNASLYGMKRYGRGQYGEGTLIYNSARKGGSKI